MHCAEENTPANTSTPSSEKARHKCVCKKVFTCFCVQIKSSSVRRKKGPPLSRCEGESFQIQKFDPSS